MTHGTLPSGVSFRRHVLGDQSYSRQPRPPTGENERNYVKCIDPNSHGGLSSATGSDRCPFCHYLKATPASFISPLVPCFLHSHASELTESFRLKSRRKGTFQLNAALDPRVTLTHSCPTKKCELRIVRWDRTRLDDKEGKWKMSPVVSEE